jgi:putative addiction module component (TIGR02574 family)
MDPVTALEAVQTWPVSDQLEFVFRVWDQLVDGGWQPELTDDLKAELDRRLAAYAANPSNVRTWEQVLEHVRRPR